MLLIQILLLLADEDGVSFPAEQYGHLAQQLGSIGGGPSFRALTSRGTLEARR